MRCGNYSSTLEDNQMKKVVVKQKDNPSLKEVIKESIHQNHIEQRLDTRNVVQTFIQIGSGVY